MGAIKNHAMGIAELHFVKCVGGFFGRTTLEVLATGFFDLLLGFFEIVAPEGEVMNSLRILTALVLAFDIACPIVGFVGKQRDIDRAGFPRSRAACLKVGHNFCPIPVPRASRDNRHGATRPSRRWTSGRCLFSH